MADLRRLSRPCAPAGHELAWSPRDLAFVCRKCGRSSRSIVEAFERQPPDGSYSWAD